MGPALRYSVALALRLGLPLSAVVLLSTIFLVSRSIDPNEAVRMSGLDATQMTRTPRIASARFAGVTQDATSLTIEAQAVRSDNTDPEAGPLSLRFVAPSGVLEFPNASQASFLAETAHLDQQAGLLTAQGPVSLRNSDGYALQLGALSAALDRTRLVGTGGVSGQAPAGELQADALELTRSGGPEGGYLLAFTGNVRLIYSPD